MLHTGHIVAQGNFVVLSQYAVLQHLRSDSHASCKLTAIICQLRIFVHSLPFEVYETYIVLDIDSTNLLQATTRNCL